LSKKSITTEIDSILEDNDFVKISPHTVKGMAESLATVTVDTKSELYNIYATGVSKMSSMSIMKEKSLTRNRSLFLKSKGKENNKVGVNDGSVKRDELNKVVGKNAFKGILAKLPKSPGNLDESFGDEGEVDLDEFVVSQSLDTHVFENREELFRNIECSNLNFQLVGIEGKSKGKI
jgi:hypothetical protein